VHRAAPQAATPPAAPATQPLAVHQAQPERRPAPTSLPRRKGPVAQAKPPLAANNPNLRRALTGPAMWQNPLLQRQSRPCRGYKSTCWVSLQACWRLLCW
jgi:hypothetical protein